MATETIPGDLQAVDVIRGTLVQYVAANLETKEGKSKAKAAQMRELLNAMLPPRDVDGEKQTVSTKPATREDVIKLQMALDDRLQLRQARESGICPVREELYSQTFDELIREVAIECPERGLLLIRVRDEIRMSIAAYQTLYESSIAFGTRKSLQAEIGTGNVTRKIEELEARKKDLVAKMAELRSKYDKIERQDAEKRSAIEKKRQEEKEFLKRQRQHLESFLKTTIG